MSDLCKIDTKDIVFSIIHNSSIGSQLLMRWLISLSPKRILSYTFRDGKVNSHLKISMHRALFKRDIEYCTDDPMFISDVDIMNVASRVFEAIDQTSLNVRHIIICIEPIHPMVHLLSSIAEKRRDSHIFITDENHPPISMKASNVSVITTPSSDIPMCDKLLKKISSQCSPACGHCLICAITASGHPDIGPLHLMYPISTAANLQPPDIDVFITELVTRKV